MPIFRLITFSLKNRLPIGKFPTASSRKRRITKVSFVMRFLRDPKSQSRIWDRNFLFWARSKNPEILGIGIEIWKSRVKNLENSEIPGIEIGLWKPRKISESEITKISKTRGFGSGFENPEENFEKIPEKFRVENPGNPRDMGFFESRDFYSRDSGFFWVSEF